MKATYEARLETPALFPLFQAIAALMARVEHTLLVELHVKGRPLLEVKREFLTRFGVTARQFNAVLFNLAGKVEAAKESMETRRRSLSDRIESAQKWLQEKRKEEARLSKLIAAEVKRIASGSRRRPPRGQELARLVRRRDDLRFRIFHKQRYVAAMEQELAQLVADLAAGTVHLCFGSRELFNKQFHLPENGYETHEQWLADWQAARASQFYCLGSADENGGNQTLSHLAGGTLRLRVPPALEREWGRWVHVPTPRFAYQGGRNRRTLEDAWARGETVSYRFLRRDRKKGWYLQAVVEAPEAEEVVTIPELGAIGVDLNPDHVAKVELDRFGNPLLNTVERLPIALYRRSHAQIEACLGNVVAAIVAEASAKAKPVVAERLEFQAKKAQLRERGGPRYARMLSSFAYRRFITLLQAACARAGVDLILVSPAFTSLVGLVKFAGGYGLSAHQAAAVAIGRRGMGRRERPSCRCRDAAGCTHQPHPVGLGEALRTKARNARALPGRNRARHVWSDWRRHARRLRREFAIGLMRCPSEGGHGGGPRSPSSAARAPSADGPHPAEGARRGRGRRVGVPAGSRERCSPGEQWQCH